VKLADFGIASLTGDPAITATGDMVVGSPSFMAPEQARAEGSGTATDLWGLGATLYFAVEGERPFDKGQAIATLHAVVSEPPRPAERAGPLAPLLSALLAKDPSDRPTVEQTRAMLDQGAEQVPAPDTLAVTAPAPATAPAQPPRPQPQPQPKRPADRGRSGRRGLAVAGVLAVVLLLAVGLAALVLRDDEPGEQAQNGGGGGAAAAPEEPQDAAEPEWSTYTDESTGYTVRYPAGWEVVPNSATAVDFEDPSSGTYLRIDHVSPPGDDPVAAWEDYEPSFASRYPDYERVRIEQADFKDLDGAIWEYTYAGQHAINHGFVTDDVGFALNFVTAEEDWESSQDLFEQLADSFELPDGADD
jgi:hypothetical protein